MGYRRGTLLSLRLGAALPGVLVLLAGCSANVSHPSALGSTSEAASAAPSLATPRSPASAPVSSSPSPAASSSASASASPISGTPTTAAATPTASAAAVATHVRATAREFIDDFNIALTTGDVTRIEALTSTTCGCRKLVNTIKQHSAKGERYDGVAFTLKSIDVSLLAAGANSEVKYSISAGRVLDASGKAVNTSSPTPDGDADLFIIRANGRWIVQQSYLLGASDQ